MRLKTEQFLTDCWRWLCTQDHQWDTHGDFVGWATESQPEVDYGAVNTYLTKIDGSKPWSESNARIVNIQEEWEMNRVLTGSYQFKQEIYE